MVPEARTLTIAIDSLAVGGDGVGRANGKVCFVPFAVPGDRVIVRVVRERRRALWGRIVEVVSPSPRRREPPCGLFGVCGGCAWMNVDYPEQLGAKRAMVSRAVGLPDVDVVPSPRVLGYRRLARLHAGSGVTGEAAFGFMAAGAGGIVDVRSCPVLEPALSRVLEPIAHAVLREAGRGTSLEVRLAGGGGRVIASVESRAPLSQGLYEGCARLVPGELAGLVASADGVGGVVAGEGHLGIVGGDGLPLTVPAGGFGQANEGVNLELARTVAQWVGAGGNETALELFAGAGNLSVALAPLVGRLDTGEIDGRACAAAARNLEARGCASATVHRGEALELYRRHGRGRSAIVLDPPRTGHRELAAAIGQGDHRAVVYVSCDPATLSRDLGELAAGGYRPARARAFDMFPQTAHVEAAVLLERDGGRGLAWR